MNAKAMDDAVCQMVLSYVVTYPRLKDCRDIINGLHSNNYAQVHVSCYRLFLKLAQQAGLPPTWNFTYNVVDVTARLKALENDHENRSADQGSATISDYSFIAGALGSE